jgi:hypothetical protein
VLAIPAVRLAALQIAALAIAELAIAASQIYDTILKRFDRLARYITLPVGKTLWVAR